MRLGQLARKYDVSQQEIISYLKEIGSAEETFHSNSKLDDDTEALVVKRFKVSSENKDDLEEQNENNSIETDKNTIDTEELDQEEEVELSQVDSDVSELESEVPKEDEVIETDKLLELLESEDTPVDLDKIRLIKAPKKELEGLKVVGKIELPEPKTKTEDVIEELESETKSASSKTSQAKPDVKGRQRRRLVTDEELEERRLRAKRKKEEHEARKEKRRKEKEERKRKSRREAHYKQRMQQKKSKQPTQEVKPETEPITTEVEESRSEPKTIFGKFWRWLNTP